jgi:hypothetical protein
MNQQQDPLKEVKTHGRADDSLHEGTRSACQQPRGISDDGTSPGISLPAIPKFLHYEMRDLRQSYALYSGADSAWGVLGITTISWDNNNKESEDWIVIRIDAARAHRKNLESVEIIDIDRRGLHILEIVDDVLREARLKALPYDPYPPPSTTPYRFISAYETAAARDSGGHLREISPALCGFGNLKIFERVESSRVTSALGQDLLPIKRLAHAFDVLRLTDIFRGANIAELITALFDLNSTSRPDNSRPARSAGSPYIREKTPATEFLSHLIELQSGSRELALDLIELFDCSCVTVGISRFFESLSAEARDYLRQLEWSEDSVARAAATFEELRPLERSIPFLESNSSENDPDSIFDGLFCTVSDSSISLGFSESYAPAMDSSSGICPFDATAEITLRPTKTSIREATEQHDPFLAAIDFPHFRPWSPEQSSPADTAAQSDCASSQDTDETNSGSNPDYSDFLLHAAQSPLQQNEKLSLESIIAACRNYYVRRSCVTDQTKKIYEIAKCVENLVTAALVSIAERQKLRAPPPQNSEALLASPVKEIAPEMADLLAAERELTERVTESVLSILMDGAPEIVGQIGGCDEPTRKKIRELIQALVSSDSCGLGMGLSKLRTLCSDASSTKDTVA